MVTQVGAPTDKWHKLKLAAAFLVMVAALAHLFIYGDTAFRQARNLRKANDHLPTLRKALEGFPESKGRFTVGAFTGRGGCLMLVGRAKTERDLEDVKRALEATNPPVPILYRVNIGTD